MTGVDPIIHGGTPPSPLRIAIVSETFLPQANGVVTRLCQALAHLRAGGDEVLLIVPEGGRAEHAGVRVHGVAGFPLPLYPDLSVAVPRPAVLRALDAFGPDVIHAVNPAILGWSAVYQARRRRTPLLCSFHTHLPRYLHHYGLGLLEHFAWDLLRALHGQADHNLCISSAMVEELHDHGFPRLELGWQGGADPDRFHPGKRDPRMRERLLGGRSDAPLLVYVGRLGAEKGVERLRPVLERLPEARLALVGDGPHRAALEEHFAGTPTTFAGRLDGAELAAAYASADCFVFPSTSETLGLVVLEAMASGTPVVAARAGGIPDLVRHGEDGFLLDADDVDAWASRIRRLLGDRSLRERVSRRARAAAERWSWAAATADLRRHYVAVLGARAAAA